METLPKVFKQENCPQTLDETQKGSFSSLWTAWHPGVALWSFIPRGRLKFACAWRWSHSRSWAPGCPWGSVGFPLEQRDGPWGSDQAEHGDTSSLLRVREFQSKTAGPFAYASRHPPGIGFIRIPVNPVRGGSSQFRAAGPERAASPGRAGLGRAGRQSRQAEQAGR